MLLFASLLAYMFNTYDLEIQVPRCDFEPESHICGKLVIVAGKPLKVSSINLKVCGRCDTSVSSTSLISGPVYDERKQTIAGETVFPDFPENPIQTTSVRFLSIELTLCSQASFDIGRYAIDFECMLPRTTTIASGPWQGLPLPSSLDIGNARICYSLQALLKRPGFFAFDVRRQVPLSLRALLVPQSRPMYAQRHFSLGEYGPEATTWKNTLLRGLGFDVATKVPGLLRLELDEMPIRANIAEFSSLTLFINEQVGFDQENEKQLYLKTEGDGWGPRARVVKIVVSIVSTYDIGANGYTNTHTTTMKLLTRKLDQLVLPKSDITALISGAHVPEIPLPCKLPNIKISHQLSIELTLVPIRGCLSVPTKTGVSAPLKFRAPKL